MTGFYDRAAAGPGHNRPEEEEPLPGSERWERWSKRRVFVREIAGEYSHIYKSLMEEPRIYTSREAEWKGGPGLYGKHVVSPQHANVAQSIETHIEAYAPGSYGQKHGHLNSAVFYVLEGKGHDIHDGRVIPWQAGDVMLVENGCVHQHFNDDEKEQALLLVFKAKPLFHFMNLIFQKIVSYPPTEPTEGNKNFAPPSDL